MIHHNVRIVRCNGPLNGIKHNVTYLFTVVVYQYYTNAICTLNYLYLCACMSV